MSKIAKNSKGNAAEHNKSLFEIYADQRGWLSACPIVSSDVLASFKSLKYQLISTSLSKHTFRGFHFQKPPNNQNKLVLIHSGEILDISFRFDVADMDSIAIHKAKAGDTIFIPKSHAHGFLSLTDNVTLQYLMDAPYVPSSYTGINGKNVMLNFLQDVPIMSDKDIDLDIWPSIENMIDIKMRKFSGQ